MLRSLGTEDGRAAARRLQDRVARWLSQRLWSINLAPELVVHDERHVSAVDAHIATVAEPLIRLNRLTVANVEALSCAAWLHDWGHVGGPIGRDAKRRPLVVTSPQAVRKYHGLISQQLISPEWAGMHGIPDTATCASTGLLCAHHQGWTSFGHDVPKPRKVQAGTFTQTMFAPRSLVDELADYDMPEDLKLGRAQLLIALLRVADGADIGRHRVPDTRSKHAFLAHCIRMQAWRARDELVIEADDDKTKNKLRALEEVFKSAGDYARAGGDQMGDGRDVSATMREVLGGFDGPGSSVLPQLLKYIEFADNQDRYYAHHSGVEQVAMRVAEPGGRTADLVVELLVTPAYGGARKAAERMTIARKAVDDVATDVRRELDSGRAAKDDSVRDVLARHHVAFKLCRADDDESVVRRLDGPSS